MTTANTYKSVTEESARNRETNDCTVKGIAIAGNVPYAEAHRALAIHGRRFRRGATMMTQRNAMKELGLEHEIVYTPSNRSGMTMTTVVKRAGLHRGHYLVWTRTHVAAVVNGKVEDWTEGRRHRVIMIARVTPRNVETAPVAPVAPAPRAPAARKQHRVEVNGTVYRSFPAALEALGCDLRGLQRVRLVLKARGELDWQGYHFVTVNN